MPLAVGSEEVVHHGLLKLSYSKILHSMTRLGVEPMALHPYIESSQVRCCGMCPFNVKSFVTGCTGIANDVWALCNNRRPVLLIFANMAAVTVKRIALTLFDSKCG